LTEGILEQRFRLPSVDALSTTKDFKSIPLSAQNGTSRDEEVQFFRIDNDD